MACTSKIGMAAAVAAGLAILPGVTMHAQSRPVTAPDWPAVEQETLEHYQALLRFDTSDPPGNERPAAEYLKQVLERAGIPVTLYEPEPNRVNVVARLKGNGNKRPLLFMAHTDVVTVDPAKWVHPPFSATREGGHVYGRGTLDDKDNVTAALMTMLSLKRLNVPLDRDVIFLAEAGEEGTVRVGIDYMVKNHLPDIASEFCFAEGGGVTRIGGRPQYASVQTAEKGPRAIELTASGTSGHGSVPLEDNAIGRLSSAIAKLTAWKPPIALNDTTRAYFERLAAGARPEDAARYRAVLQPTSPAATEAVDYFARNDPSRASMLRNSISPTMIQGGYRVNVIPSEAKATLDVRLVPGQDPAQFLDLVRTVVNDPRVTVAFAARDVRPATAAAPLDSEAFRVLQSAISRNYDAAVIPTMSTGATDMAYLRANGILCYGIGPATDSDDPQKGFGAHSDQERLLESELHRFVRLNWDLAFELARSR